VTTSTSPLPHRSHGFFRPEEERSFEEVQLMTEAEWLASKDVTAMLRFLGDRLTRRKAVLMVCAHNGPKFAELLASYPDSREGALGVRAIEVAERLLSGQAGRAEIDEVRSALDRAHAEDPGGPDVMNSAYDHRCWASTILAVAAGEESLAGASQTPWPWCAFGGPDAVEVIREAFGNPFGPAIAPGWLAWNDGAVAKLARGIDEERAFDRMPVLADALEDAGCTDRSILAHCRGPGPHVRGCFVLDLILAKE
jgi:hypothetical protein